MMAEMHISLTFLAALGSALMAGVFFAFSTFVMPALGRLPTEQGIAAMRSINVVVLNPAFLGVFLGTALLCAVLRIIALLAWQSPWSAWVMAGSLAYLLGTFLVTIAFNIPLNAALAAVNGGTSEADDLWARYLSQRTAWNHLRAVAPLVALACFIMALR
jgi:uncharacterized membrane protein